MAGSNHILLIRIYLLQSKAVDLNLATAMLNL